MKISNPFEELISMADKFELQRPEDTLSWAIDTFGGKLALATSFGPSGIVILHLVSMIDKNVKVFYLETDLFFGETYYLRKQLQARLELTIYPVRSHPSLEQQAARYGEALWRHNPELCCELRKVEPLRRYLAGKNAWVTGIRRDQSFERKTTRVVEWDDTYGLIKLNPLAGWNSEQVWDHIRKHDLPYNPLHKLGFPSIGCWPCTRSIREGEDLRAGRWYGFKKTECGLHLNGNNKTDHKDQQKERLESHEVLSAQPGRS